MTPANFVRSQTGRAEKQRTVCEHSEDNQAPIHKNESGDMISFRGKFDKLMSLLVPSGKLFSSPSYRFTYIWNMRVFLLIKEGSQVMAQDDFKHKPQGFTLGFVFELLNPILCVISELTMCNYGNQQSSQGCFVSCEGWEIYHFYSVYGPRPLTSYEVLFRKAHECFLVSW